MTLGDEPLITPAVIARFVGEPAGTRAVYDGRPGHPVVLGAEQIEALMRAARRPGRRGPAARRAGRSRCGHLCSGRDVDTPDDLEAIRDEARAVI